jgi:hypothetical protein
MALAFDAAHQGRGPQARGRFQHGGSPLTAAMERSGIGVRWSALLAIAGHASFASTTWS